MCGIAGLVISPNSSVSLEELAKRMADSLRHRGPDSDGFWVNAGEGMLLVHNRLAIQDLSEQGHQPMWSATKRYCMVFNGEIYNFRSLAKELASLGYRFLGHSDTEVLLCAIEEWGLEGAVQRSVGMFAFAIWDVKERVLSLCRDRLGEKPLYYGWIDNSFYFASELKALEVVISRGKLEMNPQGLTKYLQYGYITAPDSIYRGIYKLVPGTILTCPLEKIRCREDFSPCANTSRFSPRTFWSALDVANHGLNNLIKDNAEAVDSLDSLLHDTVKMQKIADVGVGVFLSGGIDSSVVAAIAQNQSTNRIRTFSIGFSEKEFDESMHAEKVAQHLGTDHSTINVTSKDTLQVVPELPLMFDEPFADSSQIPTYIVSKFARSHVAVCLSGDGGDELFAGYNRYLSTDNIWNKISHIPYILRKASGKLLMIPSPGFWDGIYGKMYSQEYGEMGTQKQVGLKLQKLAGLMQQRDLMSGYEYLLSYWDHPKTITSLNKTHADKCREMEYPLTDSFINKAMYLDQTGYLQGDNLAKVDRASMAVSLETRLPLLSHEIVELSWRIPVTMKARGKTSKWVLREVLSRYVPSKLIERPKMGFSVPVAQWLGKDLREWAGDLLCAVNENSYGLLMEKPILSAWDEHLAGKRDHSQRLWTILMLLSWLQKRPTG